MGHRKVVKNVIAATHLTARASFKNFECYIDSFAVGSIIATKSDWASCIIVSLLFPCVVTEIHFLSKLE